MMNLSELVDYASECRKKLDKLWDTSLLVIYNEVYRKKITKSIYDAQCLLDEQVKLLHAIKAGAIPALAVAKAENYALGLFLIGSATRLEYIHSASDIDFLPVTKETERGKHLTEENKRIYAFEKCLIANINKEVKDQFGTNPKEVGIDKAPINFHESAREAAEVALVPQAGGESLSFFSDYQLSKQIGKEWEAAWASFERAHLIFESVIVNEKTETPDFIEGLYKEIDENIYGITPKIASEAFPISGYYLIRLIMKSGLLAKAAAISSGHVSEAKGNVDAELVKAVMGRFWPGAINLILLHIMFWHSKLLTSYSIQIPKVRKNLISPPLYKLIEIIRSYSEEINYEGIGAWKKILPEAEASEVWKDFNFVYSHLKFSGDNYVEPLWFLYIRLSNLKNEINQEIIKLRPETINDIAKINKIIRNILSKCTSISEIILGNAAPPTEAYPKFCKLLIHELLS
jgi:hypothetical protein